jgi:predicted AAA+ superfamily ATPase
MNTNERQRKIIIDKGNELSRLRDEIEEIRDKARERDQVNNTNKNLVTKYYGQTTAMGEKDKRIQELKEYNQKLQDQLREVQRQPNQTIRNTPSLSKGSPRRSDLPSSVKRVGGKSSGLALALHNNQSTTSLSS